MTYSDAQKRASMKYAKSHYHRIGLDLQKPEYDRLKAHCDAIKKPVNTFIKEAITEKMNRDRPE